MSRNVSRRTNSAPAGLALSGRVTALPVFWFRCVLSEILARAARPLDLRGGGNSSPCEELKAMLTCQRQHDGPAQDAPPKMPHRGARCMIPPGGLAPIAPRFTPHRNAALPVHARA